MTPKLVPLILQEELCQTVTRLAQTLDQDYAGQSLLAIGILKGSFIFFADLVRTMQTPIHCIEFIRLSSYGSSTMSSGAASILMGISQDLVEDQTVLLVEDIVDTGITTQTAIDYLQAYRPASLKLCALLDKPSHRKVPVAIDYLGLTVPDRFIVGYGIDFDQRYRQLPAIYYLEE
ncbi:MAG: hypoxanthine phosphoribosyltransferase [Thermosynechococcaceae cyanobacterium]